MRRMFVIGYDNIYYHCIICGEFGMLLVCTLYSCGRAYCSKCVVKLSSGLMKVRIIEDKTWRCFICERNNILNLRNDWRQQVYHLFNKHFIPIPEISLIKRKIRVLSLFDGISSALVALKKLQIPTDVYFASEIDETAIRVSKNWHSNEIVYVGDITYLDDNELSKLIPIDLVIGGSPCNELSLANPDRKGLFDASGSGILFFEYYRILMTLHSINGRPFFWLFENVSSMTTEAKETISTFLESEPLQFNAEWVSPQKRERFFWGNCPSVKGFYEVTGPHLQDYLLPNRKALFDCVATITTRSNSLLQGAELERPVKDEYGQEDYLLIEEIENIFGFVEGYTDLDLTRGERRMLLGRSWSVQAACTLLHFLRFYFISNVKD